MSSDLEQRVAAAVLRVLGERDHASPTSRHDNAVPTTRPEPNGADAPAQLEHSAGGVVTLADVTHAAQRGAALRTAPGAIVTDLAREEAVRRGVLIISRDGAQAQPRLPVAPTQPWRSERQSGSDYCTQCGGCMQPAVYTRSDRAVAASTSELCARLDRFTELAWRSEPNEIRRLRQLRRPPMGRMPGVFYACFNLFWLGEELQSLRDRAKAQTMPLAALNEILAALLARHAVRLSKWHLVDLIELLGDTQSFLEQRGPASTDEYRSLCEHLMLAVDRVQSWIDRMIPWHTLDDRLELVP